MNSDSWIDVINRFENLSEDRGSGRLNLLEMFYYDLPSYDIDKIILGHGYGTFVQKYGYASPHNDYVDMFFSYGVFAFVGFITLVFRLIKNVFGNIHFRISYIAFLCIFLILNLTGGIFCYYKTSCVLFIYLGLIDAVCSYSNQTQNKLLIK